jgi:hypothetical protein
MGLDINIETKHNSHYNKSYIFLHENIDYSQMYNLFSIDVIFKI